MSQKTKTAGSPILDSVLTETTPLSIEELDRVNGGLTGSERAAMLLAMGWKPYIHNCLDKNGMSGRTVAWVKDGKIAGSGKCYQS